MAKIKISIQKRRQILRDLSISFSVLAFILVFFEFCLALRDDWDDLNMGAVFVAPLFAAVGMMLAILNIVRCRAKTREIIGALAMVALSALFFCFVMLSTSARYMHL